MKKQLLFLLILLSSALSQASVSVIPMPQKCVERKGAFVINEHTIISLPTDNEEMRAAISVWNDQMSVAAGFRLEVSASAARASNMIRCRINPSLRKDEAYKLDVSKSSVQVEAKTAKGIFYAFQTLRQLMPPAIEQEHRVEEGFVWQVPCVTIEDAPSFAYRGLMLDVSRHFMPKEVVKRYIDLMAFHKLNTFHWHLTDDQGWRIEIKKYPKLTSMGGFRNKTIIGHAKNKPYKWEVERYGGFYTQDDVREIVAYAQKRCVEVIPEIEMPGHAVAALAAYPEYSCSGGPFEVEGRWGVFNDIFCTKEATFEFMQNILDEVTSLFPSTYIHIGGDEAPRVRWKNCVHCRQRMEQENLTKEEQLQTYFINRIERHLNAKGKRIIGWDEIIEGGIPQRATVMSWRGEKGGIHAAKAGYDVIMTPNTHLYLNHYQYSPQTEPLAFGGFTPLEKSYSYHPVHESLTPEEAKHIKGVQANLWTEYITSVEQLEYMLYPRAAALSEVAWSRKENRNYDSFYKRLQDIEKHYDAMKLNYCKLVYGK
ncbi:beta-N-acetylhexosaminidase [uncultured Bacteroides sp.]|jgi:hexosaminidase|uniref:beta-N-acetylhexosaminidase n=1 Tax=uncultured Bacteroides sp. TaxID=162156 RepID=UPI00258CA218|nr:beta-N-acetylhexosaminidase [uncultured Bacteroides sp.]